MKKLAICDTVCQVTRGAEPQYAATVFSQWIRRRLEENGWRQKDFAARLEEAAGDRMRAPGAVRLAQRAAHGENISPANIDLIRRVLGEPEGVALDDFESDLERRLAKAEGALNSLGPALERLADRVSLLEQRVPPKKPRVARKKAAR